MNIYTRTIYSPVRSPDRRSVSPIQNLKSSSYQYNDPTLGQSQTIKKQLQQQQQSNNLKQSAVQGRYSGSPDNNNKITEAGLWQSRCNDLEGNLYQVNKDLEVANYKAMKARDLENKVDLILKQNQQLLSENDQIQKQLNQKKTESDIWKQKYESQMNTIIQLKANYEIELKKSKEEALRTRELLELQGQENFREVEDTKGRLFIESSEKVEHLKRAHAQNGQYYEEQLRKLRDTIKDRDMEIEELNYKLNNTRNDQETEQIRLNQDRDRLRLRIQQLEKELQDELNNQRLKIDSQFEKQIKSIRDLHKGEIDTLESELKKLKDLIEIKNLEIQGLIDQNKYQKQNFENENDDLRLEINILKEKIKENNHDKEDEINQLKEKLAHLHIKDTQDLKQKHEEHEQTLRTEINALQNLLGQKSEELDNQFKEKRNQQDAYLRETIRLRDEINNLNSKYRELEQEKEKQLIEAQVHLQKSNSSSEDFINQLKNQIDFLQNEISELKVQIIKKNEELSENTHKSQTQKAVLEEELRTLKKINDDLNREIQLREQEKYMLIDEHKTKNLYSEDHFLSKIKEIEAHRDLLDRDLRLVREQLLLKTEENNNLSSNKRVLENDIRTLRAEIDNLGDQIIYLEKLKAKELHDQRIKLEQSNQFSEENLKRAHKNQVLILQEQIQTLKLQNDNKQKDIEDMINKYEQIEKEFSLFSQNQQQLEDYENKIRLLGAEVLTTKNLYDVFTKSKSRFQRK